MLITCLGSSPEEGSLIQSPIAFPFSSTKAMSMPDFTARMWKRDNLFSFLDLLLAPWAVENKTFLSEDEWLHVWSFE